MAIRILLGLGVATAVSSLGVFAGKLAKGSLVSDVALSSLTASGGLQHEWRLRRGKHWQIVSTPTESTSDTDRAESTRGACSTGMVEVKGKMRTDPPPGSKLKDHTVEELQKTACTKWINRDYPERCAEFDRPKWLEIAQELPQKDMSFCMDRFEYPNEKGVFPWIAVSWYEANDICGEEGKRLCDENEWTFACEGEEATPYPYGYVRNADACDIDRRWRPFHEAAMRPRDGDTAMAEFDRLWQGVQSGSQPLCKSVFGVYDMTGNIDEWTRTSHEGERPSILKGGYWGPVRTRCRPSTRSHDENHVFYQEGFRCCTDPGATPVKKAVSDDPASVPLPDPVQ